MSFPGVAGDVDAKAYRSAIEKPVIGVVVGDVDRGVVAVHGFGEAVEAGADIFLRVYGSVNARAAKVVAKAKAGREYVPVPG